jgi:hypothetical protein
VVKRSKGCDRADANPSHHKKESGMDSAHDVGHISSDGTFLGE